MSGVTFQSLGFEKFRHWSTWKRSSLMTAEVGSYCCFSVESPLPSSKTNSAWDAFAVRFRGLGIGVMNSARRRLSMIRCVGWPCSSSSQY